MPLWFEAMIILAAVIGIGSWSFAIIAWFRGLRPWRSMVANRTRDATWLMRLVPFWFLKNSLLTPEGVAARTEVLYWTKLFFLGWMGVALAVGMTLLVGFYVVGPAPH